MLIIVLSDTTLHVRERHIHFRYLSSHSLLNGTVCFALFMHTLWV